MRCDACGGEMTPMIYSWFCPNDCDRRSIPDGPPPIEDVEEALDIIGRVVDRLRELGTPGYVFAPCVSVIKPVPISEETRGFEPGVFCLDGRWIRTTVERRMKLLRRYSVARVRSDFFGTLDLKDLP